MTSHVLKWHLQNIVPVETVDDVGVSGDDVDVTGGDDDVGDTLKLPVRLMPIWIPEPPHPDPDTTCRVYATTAFGCNSDNENMPVVSVS